MALSRPSLANLTQAARLVLCGKSWKSANFRRPPALITLNR
jgi:hypothetical protein